MINTLLKIFATGFVIASFFILYFNLKNKLVSILDYTLYKERDPKKYLELLNTKRAKLLFSKSNLMLMQANVFHLCGDIQKLNEIIHRLEGVHLNKSQLINYLYLRILTEVQMNKTIDISKTWKQIEKNEKLFKDRDKLEEYHECEILYRLYAIHDKSLEPLLKSDLAKQSGSQRTITLFRLAKISYWRGDNTAARDYLRIGLKSCDNPDVSKKLNSCIEDLEVLNSM